MKEYNGCDVDKIKPNLIKDLYTINNKGKIVNIKMLNQFAYCTQKQLPIYVHIIYLLEVK
jgi:hypothetical protein